ncbi:uncharacterized protein METZ01_LOCUS23608, partial [marine metagenome]
VLLSERFAGNSTALQIETQHKWSIQKKGPTAACRQNQKRQRS